MQLKLRRSQRQTGVISKSVVFCLDARAEFDAQEQQLLTTYNLWNTVIYNSAASLKHQQHAANTDGSLMGNLSALGSLAMAGMSLNISIGSLSRGQHIECKDLNELLGAEEAVMSACRDLKHHLEIAQTFDGREVVIDFDRDEIVAQATPQQALAAPAPPPPAPKKAKAAAVTHHSVAPEEPPMDSSTSIPPPLPAAAVAPQVAYAPAAPLGPYVPPRLPPILKPIEKLFAVMAKWLGPKHEHLATPVTLVVLLLAGILLYQIVVALKTYFDVLIWPYLVT